ncbi:MAG: Fic family protein [Methylocystis sp.]
MSDTSTSLAVTRLRKAGQLRKLAPRLYTTNMTDSIESIVQRNAWQIVGLLAPGTVVGFRTAFEVKPADDGSIFVTGGYPRTLKLAGLTIRQQKGPGALPGDSPFLGNLYLASQPRAFLENLMPSREREGVARTVARTALEERLAKLAASGKPDVLNKLRDQARTIAPKLNAEDALSELNNLISGLHGSKPARFASAVARAMGAGEPYDPKRVECFAKLFADLQSTVFQNMPDSRGAGEPDRAFYNLAFFDAYFSNYIEGTKFEVDQAIDIVFNERIPSRRPADAHDVIGTYEVVGRLADIGRVPRTFEGLQSLLRERHRSIMSGRPDKRPGEFKEENNRVGSTVFVDHKLVNGTLKQGFDLYRSLEDPMARALMIKFIVSEIHPFDDGNGRTARAMMNADLITAEQRRIIIPSVYRSEYLGGLKRLSNHQESEAYIRVMSYAQLFCSRIDFADLASAEATMRSCHAFEEPADGVKLALPPKPAASAA